MNLLLRFGLFLGVLVVCYSAKAQRQVVGRVVDAVTKRPIKEASVKLDGRDSTRTNFLGYFQMFVDSTSHGLQVSSQGYLPAQIPIPLTDQFQVPLTKDDFPEYEGGWEEFQRMLGKHIQYPGPAMRMYMQGLVYATFEVDTLGQMRNIRMLTDIEGYFGETVIHALEKVPNKWIPIKSSARFILPVIYEMEGSSEPQYEVEVELPIGKVLKEIKITGLRVEMQHSRPVYVIPRTKHP